MEATDGLRWRPLSGSSTYLRSAPAELPAQLRERVIRIPGEPERQASVRQQTLSEWLDEWLELCSARGLRAITVQGYRIALRLYLELEVASKPLASVTGQDLNALYRRLLRNGRRDGRGLSARTVRYLHTILSRAFSDAVRAGAIEVNPARSADPPSPRASRAQIFDVWSPSELAQFLHAALDDPLYVAFRLAAATGLRRSELLGLRWCDIDLVARELRVVQALVCVGNVLRITPPKTERSRRGVALDHETSAILARYRSLAEKAEGFDDRDLVFRRPNREPIHPALLSYHFQQRIRLAGVRRIRFHDLRHSHATHALQAGVHPKVVSERLGHSSVMITLDTYSHVLPGLQREAAEAVAALLTGKAQGGPGPDGT